MWYSDNEEDIIKILKNYLDINKKKLLPNTKFKIEHIIRILQENRRNGNAGNKLI